MDKRCMVWRGVERDDGPIQGEPQVALFWVGAVIIWEL